MSQAGTGAVALGGFAGMVYATKIESCFSASPLTLTNAPDAENIFVGGFIGYVVNFAGKESPIISCYTEHTEGILIDITGDRLYVGGLIGYTSGTGFEVTKSYATGDIVTVATGRSFTGALLGYALGITISESWASGNVRALGGSPRKSGTSYVIYAGGLAGWLATNSKIENSYALGDVLADDLYAGGPVYAGGLAGYLASVSGSGSGSGGVYHSFATGSVRARTNSASDVYAGGLVGYRDTGDIQHCAALGATVTAAGTSTNKAAARIFGFPAAAFSGASGSSSDNYAAVMMETGTADTYEETLVTAPVNNADATQPNGKDVADDGTGLRDWYFWNYDLRFNPSLWDFAGVVARGYPVLTNTGGQ
jgi:hypothetical protein